MSTLSSQVVVTFPHDLSQESNRATILIADSDEDYRQLYSDLLRSEGFHTFCAKNVDQALAVLHHERIDIALVDGMMPKMNGMTVCRELRGNPETRLVPILLLTSWESAPGRAMGIEAGADNLEDAEKMLLIFAELVEAKNPYTAGHGFRVSRTAVSLPLVWACLRK